MGVVSKGRGCMDDPYSVLGLNRDASEREIKKKYQELVRKVKHI